MAHRPVEIILTRQLASYLAVPALVVDPEGALVFYNEAAEPLIGRRFEETGRMDQHRWLELFNPLDQNGKPLPEDARPLLVANREQRPIYRRVWVEGLDGAKREVQVSAFPLLGQTKDHLGTIALLWEGD